MLRLQRLACGPRHRASVLLAIGVAAIAFAGAGHAIESSGLTALAGFLLLFCIPMLAIGFSHLRRQWLPDQHAGGPASIAWTTLGIVLLVGALWPTGPRRLPDDPFVSRETPAADPAPGPAPLGPGILDAP